MGKERLKEMTRFLQNQHVAICDMCGNCGSCACSCGRCGYCSCTTCYNVEGKTEWI